MVSKELRNVLLNNSERIKVRLFQALVQAKSEYSDDKTFPWVESRLKKIDVLNKESILSWQQEV